jgi:hypothetical protein
MTYIAGLDIAQQHDYTALSILDVQGDPPRVEVAQLIRWRGVEYPEIVRQVCTIMHSPPLWSASYALWEQAHQGASRCDLVVDRTGVGLPVVDMFREAGIAPLVAVFIHGGREVNHKGLNYNVPKVDLVSGVQVLIQEGRLRIAPVLPEATTLTQELLNFRYTLNPATAHESYAAGREKEHDDMVLSVALACWWGEWSTRTAIPPDLSLAINTAFHHASPWQGPGSTRHFADDDDEDERDDWGDWTRSGD